MGVLLAIAIRAVELALCTGSTGKMSITLPDHCQIACLYRLGIGAYFLLASFT